MYKCSYCKCMKLERKKYFENNLICKSCLNVVPKWTQQLRKELNEKLLGDKNV